LRVQIEQSYYAARMFMSLDQRMVSRARIRRWIFDEPCSNRATAHDGFEVSWCHEGEIEYRAGGEVLVLRPGAAIIVPPMVAHGTSVAMPGRAGSLLLATDAVQRAAESAKRRLDLPRLVPGTRERPAVLTTLGEKLDHEVWSDGSTEAVDALVDQLITELVNTGETPGASGDRHSAGEPRPARDYRIRRALELIHECYADSLTLDRLAASANMSRFYFSRVFRQAMGKSPHQYLLEVRLARAAELLGAHQCTVTEAAVRVGCNDLGRFGRTFRQVYGVRPSEYAERAAS
jgi:AraC family transcriptional regulator